MNEDPLHDHADQSKVLNVEPQRATLDFEFVETHGTEVTINYVWNFERMERGVSFGRN